MRATRAPYSTAWTAARSAPAQGSTDPPNMGTCGRDGARHPACQGNNQFSVMKPFFSPAPLEWPHIPIYIEGWNPYVKLAGELDDGHIIHACDEVQQRDGLPNVDAGWRRRAASGATSPRHKRLRSPARTATRSSAPRRGAQQISFYASTRTPWCPEAHGGARRYRWREAAKGDGGGCIDITDEMSRSTRRGAYEEVRGSSKEYGA